MRAIERTAIRYHKCGFCEKTINPGDRCFEVTYKLNGRYWYTEYYHYNHW